MSYQKPTPTDLNLYNKTKKNVYKKYPKHSAYRSGILVQTYKKNFKNKYGNHKNPYTGKKTQKKGLSRWFKEEWKNQRGSIGYKYKSDVYRPTKRITKKTPITFKELNEEQVKKARQEKYNKGRVNRFKKGGKYSLPNDKHNLYDLRGTIIDYYIRNRPMHEIEINNNMNNQAINDVELDEVVISEPEQVFINFAVLYHNLLEKCFNDQASNIDELNNIKTLRHRKIHFNKRISEEDYDNFCLEVPNIDFTEDPEMINNLEKHQIQFLIMSSEKILDLILLNHINARLDNASQLTMDNLHAFMASNYQDISQISNITEIKYIKIICYCLIYRIILNIVEDYFGERLLIFDMDIDA